MIHVVNLNDKICLGELLSPLRYSEMFKIVFKLEECIPKSDEELNMILPQHMYAYVWDIPNVGVNSEMNTTLVCKYPIKIRSICHKGIKKHGKIYVEDTHGNVYPSDLFYVDSSKIHSHKTIKSILKDAL